MSKNKTKGFAHLKDMLQDFPVVEALLSITWVIFGAIAVSKLSTDVEEVSDSFRVTLALFLPLILLALSLRHLGWKWLYAASYFLWIPLLFWGEGLLFTGVVALYALSFIFMVLVFSGGKGNGMFARSLLRSTEGLFFGSLVGVGGASIVMLLCETVGWLFDLEIPTGDVFLNLLVLFGPTLGLIILLVIMRDMDDSDDEGVSYNLRIIPVFLLIYIVILYVYAAKILIQWELPKGGVAYLVCAMLILGLFSSIFGQNSTIRLTRWFNKWFPVLSIPLLVLLWVGIARRISDYGLTETRVYLLLAAGLLTLFTGMCLFSKTRNFSAMAIILAAAIVLFTFIPGLKPKDIALRQQEARFRDSVAFIEAFNGDASAPELVKAKFRARESYHFLKGEMDFEEFEEKYGIQKVIW